MVENNSGDETNVPKDKKPIDLQAETNKETNWDKIRRTLSPQTQADSPSTPKENNYETRRSALQKVGLGIGAAGLVGAGAIGGYYYGTQDDPTAPAIIEEEEDPENDEPAPEPTDYQDIPGPETGEGYQIDTDTLEEYNPSAWENINSEEEYEELEPNAEWYLQEDGTVVGVNEEEQIVRIFSTEEFPENEEYTQLYEDLEDD